MTNLSLVEQACQNTANNKLESVISSKTCKIASVDMSETNVSKQLPPTKSRKTTNREKTKKSVINSNPSPKQEMRRPEKQEKITPNTSPIHNPTLSPINSPKSPITGHRIPTPSSNNQVPSSVPGTNFIPGSMGPSPPANMGQMTTFFNGFPPNELPRNTIPQDCSNVLRSLAAKYNKNNNCPPGFINNANVYNRPIIPNEPGFPDGNAVSPNRPADSSAPIHDISKQHPPANNHHVPIPPQFLAGHPGFPGLAPNQFDMPPSHVLINMIRNASNLHQHQNNQNMQNEFLNHHNITKQYFYQQQQRLQKYGMAEHSPPPPIPLKSLPPTSVNEGKIEPQSVQPRNGVKRSAESTSPLDLSATIPSKYMKRDTDADINVEEDESKLRKPTEYQRDSESSNDEGRSGFEAKDDVSTWTVDDVFFFVASVDICAEYADNFREQRIDGACLQLLNESHLTESLRMKLGPALKLRRFLTQRIQQSHNQNNNNDYNHHYNNNKNNCSTCNNCSSPSNYNNNNNAFDNNNRAIKKCLDENGGQFLMGNLSSPERKSSPLSLEYHNSPGGYAEKKNISSSESFSPNCSRV